MKKCIFRSTALILAVFMLFSLFACKPQGSSPSETVPDITTEAPDPSVAVKATYDEGVKKLLENKNVHLDITVNTTRTVGCEDYLMTTERSADLLGIGGEDLTAVITDKISLNSTVIYRTETFSGGNLFSQYKNNDETYLSTIAKEDFLCRAMYVNLLSSELYGDAAYKDDESTVVFSNATALEAWVAPDYAKFISAEGEAVIKDGAVETVKYTAEYRQGSAIYSSVYTIRFGESELSFDDISVPLAENCRLLDNADIPLYFHLAADTFENSNTVINNTSEEMAILSGSAPVIISSYTDNLYMHKQAGEIYAKDDGNFMIRDAKTDQSTSWTDVFSDGISTSSVDGAEPKQDNASSADYVKVIRESLMMYMPELSELSKITSAETEEFLLIEYEYGENSLTDWEDYITDSVYDDPSYLDRLSSQYKIIHSGGYIAFDLDSLIPTGISVTFSGTHVIENQPVTVTLEGYQSLDISNDMAYYEITGKYPETKEPEAKPTPLFYEVTSPEGAKMYLLGTIHIGDDRTAHLPAEIYGALEESDALALEINQDTFMDEVMASNVYTDLYREGTFYIDGTTVKDHLPEELYNDAMNFLKMTGQYISAYEYCRPAALSSIIEYSYYDTSHVLHSYKGVDRNLMTLAEEKGMEIRSIETVEDRLNMDIRYTDAIHGFLLESAVYTTRYEMMGDSEEMFDLWCEGDEKKLSEYLNEEPEFSEDATEEEIAEYEKYENIMVAERDAKMLERAKQYLENKDEVVFFAVGIGHFFSETGLIEGLREAGYTVELVEYE